MSMIIKLTAIVVAVGFVAGCGEKQPVAPEPEASADKQAAPEAVTVGDVREQSAEALDSAGMLAKQTRDEYAQQVEDEVEAMQQRLEKLQAKTESMGAQANAAWEDRLDQLAAKRQDLQDSMKAVTDSTGDAWRELAQGLTRSRQEMADALQKAEAEFKAQSAD